MVNKFTIVINNRSGTSQNYILFTEKPEVTNISKSSIWTNVYQNADGVPDGATAEFEMWKNYYAIVGKWKGGPKDGAKASISQAQPVTLGSLAGDDSQRPGTTLSISVANGNASIDRAPNNDGARTGAFEVGTKNDFTLEDATENNIFVGVASSPDGNDRVATATFRPEPGNQYHIQPSNVFYVATGAHYQAGQLLDPAKLGRQPLKIDFNVRSAVVTINHTPDGQLVIAK
ncbi:hypothetical protein FPANT_9558 [Fusarium pseudoanthophilum]|uniref:Uncharacterized protein n=1 Tax=Fusarium pseudoanthophilum TaxID=48495 RepID=A0A8H5KUU5_9HYPO|nr:hypothetical protein FPANT_9558 [Fusarium pseudoanthophilum]